MLPRTLVRAFLLAAALLGAAPGAADGVAAARAEADAGSRAFSAGDYRTAAEAFGRAAGLDPSQPAYAALRARSLGELLSPGDLSKENRARLATVVAIYDGLLAAEPANEEYAQAVPRLFGRVGDEAGRDAWLAARAANAAVPPAARADALRAAAEPLVARAVKEASAGRPAEAARLAGLARARLDAALTIDAGSIGAHALRLHAFDVEIEAARAEGDAARRARLETQKGRARHAADAAIARHPSLPSPDDD